MQYKSALKKFALVSGFSLLSYFATPVTFYGENLQNTSSLPTKSKIVYQISDDFARFHVDTENQAQFNCFRSGLHNLVYDNESASFSVSVYNEVIRDGFVEEMRTTSLYDENLDGRVDYVWTETGIGGAGASELKFLRNEEKRDPKKWLEFDMMFAKYIKEYGDLLVQNPEARAKHPELKKKLAELKNNIEDYQKQLEHTLKIPISDTYIPPDRSIPIVIYN